MSEFELQLIAQINDFVGAFKFFAIYGLTIFAAIFAFKDFSTRVSVKVDKDETN